MKKHPFICNEITKANNKNNSSWKQISTSVASTSKTEKNIVHYNFLTIKILNIGTIFSMSCPFLQQTSHLENDTQ